MNFAIKHHPELRHFLRHVLLAIEELANGNAKAALYEIKTIEPVVSWQGSQRAFQRFCDHEWKGGASVKRKGKKGRKHKCR